MGGGKDTSVRDTMLAEIEELERAGPRKPKMPKHPAQTVNIVSPRKAPSRAHLLA